MTWKLKRIFIFRHWIQPPIIFEIKFVLWILHGWRLVDVLGGWVTSLHDVLLLAEKIFFSLVCWSVCLSKRLFVFCLFVCLFVAVFLWLGYSPRFWSERSEYFSGDSLRSEEEASWKSGESVQGWRHIKFPKFPKSPIFNMGQNFKKSYPRHFIIN